ncbi:MAG: hypothetical protein JKY65_01175 [Planctomycetes bacterium]|nr:hypothetical protein [Planctomycetota bacterium]
MNPPDPCIRQLDPHTLESGFVAAVAQASAARPVLEPGCEVAWRVLRDHNAERLRQIQRVVSVEFTHTNPYGLGDPCDGAVFLAPDPSHDDDYLAADLRGAALSPSDADCGDRAGARPRG